MSQFAENTSVSIYQSKSDIERLLTKYGADSFMSGWGNDEAVLAFRLKNRQVKFVLPVPKKEDFRNTPTGQKRNDDKMFKEWEQGCRRSWRSLLLVIKAKLEAVDSGITTFEEEFLAHIMLPNGETYGQFAIPQIEQAYENKSMPALLPGRVGNGSS